MPKQGEIQAKVVYKGNDENFVVFVDSLEELKSWKNDRSIPLAHFVSNFKIMINHKHGAQGILDAASKSMLENEFGTSNEDECIKKILEHGDPQTAETGKGWGDRNESKGPRGAH